MRVILIRHGETEHNAKDSITGQLDVSLNKYGVEQAEKAANRLEKYSFDAAYSSDLERTYETTKIIAERHGLEPQRYKEFRERGFGEYEGKPKDDWRKVVREHDGDRHFLKPDGGESLREVGQRFVGKLDELREKHGEDETILVGGHSVALKATMMEILNLSGEGYNKLSQDNTGLTEIKHSEKRGWKLVRMNDTAHLE
ncbi:histidine phosphatase family protein [Candidatus Nanohalococcus occultus]|uniref:histidine phosphatase family protein n=1 Tax=Candidatus Nanohalococcus occultus TaxID=2978047 RepID=UPI0039E19A55